MACRGWLGLGVLLCLSPLAACETPSEGGAGGTAGTPSPGGTSGSATGGTAGAPTDPTGAGGLPLSPPNTPQLPLIDTFPPGSTCRTVDDANWCWYNPLPVGDTWAAVGPSGPRGVVAVSGEHTLLFDGDRWSIGPAAMAYPHGIWGSSLTDIWVVGGDEAARPTIAHGDGRRFDTVFQVGGSGFADVWGSGPSDVWAVGYANVVHFDGQSWTRVDDVVDQRQLSGGIVDGSGPDDVWISGSDGLFHFDGTAWRHVTEYDFRNVGALAARAPDDVWVTATKDAITTLLHFDGATWTPTYTMSINDLVSIWALDARAANDAWAVGSRYSDEHSTGFLLHWDGHSWTEAPDSSAPLHALVSTDRYHVAVGVGGQVVQLSSVLTFRYLSSGDGADLFGVWGASPRDVWAVGRGGVTMHYDGSTVRAIATGVDATATLYDVWGSADGPVWAVGERGTLIYWAGSAWVPFPIGTTSTLRAVFVTSATSAHDIWIGGDGATLLHFDGAVATPAVVPGLDPNAVINDIHGTGPDDVWLTGIQADVAFVSHFDGASWSAPQSFDGFFTSGDRIWAVAADDVWADTSYTGRYEPYVYPTELWHYDGATWTPVPAPSRDDTWMFPVVPLADGNTRGGAGGSFAFGPDDVWSVWRNGSIARRTLVAP